MYISLVEIYHLEEVKSEHEVSSTKEVIDALKDRRFLYIPPILLFVLTTAFFGWHLQQVQRCRDDARANYYQTRRNNKDGDESGFATANGFSAQSSIVRNNRIQAFAPSAPVQPLLPPVVETNYPLQPIASTAPYQDNNFDVEEGQVESENGNDNTFYNQQRQRHGTYKYHEEGCVTCEVIREGTSFRSKMTGKNYMFMSTVSCMDENCIYLVSDIKPLDHKHLLLSSDVTELNTIFGLHNLLKACKNHFSSNPYIIYTTF